MNWIKLEEQRPSINGVYLVIWSNPYQKKVALGSQYFSNGRFENEVAGANELLYWSEFPDMPEGLSEYREEKINKRIIK